jgi:iron complex outermembrane receptor protein
MRSTRALWLGAILLGFGIADQQSFAAAEEPSASGGLDEIVVTAQRRSESAQNVPISVTAFAPADLRKIGAVQSEDLPFMVAGLNIFPTGASEPIYLRGVGNNNNGSAVLTFIDGVYYPFQAGSVVFNNISSLEVDKGPQGTLFGRNATGGVVQITTKDPSFSPTADVEVGYGNFDTQTGSLYASTGLTDKLAADIAAYYSNQIDGWGHNEATGAQVFTKKDLNLRSKWVYNLTDNTHIRMIFDYDTSEGSVGADVRPAAHVGSLFNYLTATREYFSGKYGVDSNYGPYYTSRQLGSNIRVETDLGLFKVASITSWRNERTSLYIDYDGTPIPFFNLYRYDNRDAETQEFQVMSADDSRVKWVGGLYFYNDRGVLAPFGFRGIGGSAVFGAPAGEGFNIYANDRVTSYAAFGQATGTIAPDTHLTLGARYTIDDRFISGFTAYNTDPVPGSAGEQSKRFDKPTFRASVDHNLTADALVYVSFNRGFDSGYFNQVSTGGFTAAKNPVVEPETIDAYEIGLKSEWFNHQLRVNAAGFLYNYKNLQQQVYEGAALVTVNAAAARITGVDLDAEVRPINDLTLAMSMEYLHAIYTSYDNAPSYSLAPNGAMLEAPGNASGKYIPNAPPFSANFRVSYDLHTAIGVVDSTVAVAYMSYWYADPSNFYQEPSHSLINASETWTSLDGRNHVTLWGKNLGNTFYDLGVSMLAPVGPDGNPGAPRTFGISIGHHF